MSRFNVLTDSQAQQFIDSGYVAVEDCFDSHLARDWIDFAYDRLGCSPADPSSWPEPRVHTPSMPEVDVREFAPHAFGAICDILGGEERVKLPLTWRDSFIINFNVGEGEPWEAPSPDVSGWHKDGDWFKHFLDSPEQGLLTVIIWQDIAPKSGGTFVATDSIAPIARYLLDHPEGLTPKEARFGGLIDRCSAFQELTGRTGDVVLIHPYTLHAASRNPSGIPRFITNPAVSLNEPMRFNREGADNHSLVEQAVLRALGVDSIDFRPSAPRERITPERVARQANMLEEQKARLGITDPPDRGS